MLRHIIKAAAITAALSVSTAAFADGMPRGRAPAYSAAPVYSWTGFYVGAHIGGGWSDQSMTSVDPVSDPAGDTVRGDGWLAGIHAGFNWQLGPQFVVGVEVDYTWSGIEGSGFDDNRFVGGALAGGGGVTFDQSVDWLASVRARLGLLASPSLLLYVTGGFAWASVESSVVDIHLAGPQFPASIRVSDTATGYVIGGGFEWAMAPNWLVRAEYLHYELDAGTVVTGVPRVGFPGELSTFTFSDITVDTLRVGLSYKF